jgi:hypothetical protein
MPRTLSTVFDLSITTDSSTRLSIRRPNEASRSSTARWWHRADRMAEYGPQGLEEARAKSFEVLGQIAPEALAKATAIENAEVEKLRDDVDALAAENEKLQAQLEGSSDSAGAATIFRAPHPLFNSSRI